MAVGSAARYTFTAPAGTLVTAATVRRRYSGSGAQVMAFRVGYRDQWPEWCTLYSGCTGLDGDRSFSGIDSQSYVIEQICGGPSDCPDSRTITARCGASPRRSPIPPPRRSRRPRAARWSSPAARSPVASPPRSLRDEGGGLAAVRLEVDGAPAGTWGVDANGGRCALPYAHVVPCRLAATAAIEWDSNGVPDGTHQARLLVDDAAGNTLVHGPFQIQVANTPTSCGPAVAGMRVGARFRQGGRRVTVRRGRAVRVTGRVTRAGAPLAGATVHLLNRVRRRGAATAPSGRVALTGAGGRYALRVPAGPSRTLRLGVRAGAADTGLTCSARLRLRVRAQVTLRASPRRLGGPGTVRFAGRLRGGHVPARGKLLVLQGREDDRWRTFAATRTDGRGRFHVRYRFRGVPGRYPVRALVPEDGSYPFAAGTSRRGLGARGLSPLQPRPPPTPAAGTPASSSSRSRTSVAAIRSRALRASEHSSTGASAASAGSRPCVPRTGSGSSGTTPIT